MLFSAVVYCSTSTNRQRCYVKACSIKYRSFSEILPINGNFDPCHIQYLLISVRLCPCYKQHQSIHYNVSKCHKIGHVRRINAYKESHYSNFPFSFSNTYFCKTNLYAYIVGVPTSRYQWYLKQ